MEYWLTINPWYGMILWVILYTSDYYLTIYSARGFREIGHFQFEGSMELTPQFQNDVDNLRPVSRRHVILLLITSSLIYVLWWMTHLSILTEWTYSLFLGIFILLEVAVHFRHLRSIAIIREIRKNGGVEGQIFYSQWFSYRNSANELYITGTFFLLVVLLTFSLFFFGGALACYGTALRHALWAKKAKLKAQATA
jgi:hypothetical protein